MERFHARQASLLFLRGRLSGTILVKRENIAMALDVGPHINVKSVFKWSSRTGRRCGCVSCSTKILATADPGGILYGPSELYLFHYLQIYSRNNWLCSPATSYMYVSAMQFHLKGFWTNCLDVTGRRMVDPSTTFNPSFVFVSRCPVFCDSDCECLKRVSRTSCPLTLLQRPTVGTWHIAVRVSLA